MSADRILSWLEIAAAVVLGTFAVRLLLDLRTASPEVDRHGYLAMTAAASLCLALASGLAGGLLRLSSRWRWLGQLPLLLLIVAIFIYN